MFRDFFVLLLTYTDDDNCIVMKCLFEIILKTSEVYSI